MASGRVAIADSVAHRTPLPPQAAATVDPLRTDTFSEPGVQIGGVNPQAVSRVTRSPRAVNVKV
ncbi:hypothetical protein ACIRQP_32870 [Streptomyces sp. NPDC102274]|uniref:hypothetical protein n=1 Tax=Streptomyces sp. NPDC102274 TaxID=3366151 RepID=UPI003830B17E